MKKILISILIVLLIILCISVVTGGISIGGFEVLSISQIQQSKDSLDKIISDATIAASTGYKNALDSINDDIKKLEAEKKNYEDMVTVTAGEEQKITNQYQKYEIEYLWTIVGNHATKEGVIIKMDVVAGTGTDIYNLNFTVNGSYIGITEFVSDIENDSALGFKIEDFSLQPGSSTESLEATFTCKDIEIKKINNSASSITPASDTSENVNEDSTKTTTPAQNGTTTNNNNQNDANTNTNTNSNGNATNSNSKKTTTGADSIETNQ